MTGTRSKPTPKDVDNRPGLPEVSTRVGTHALFYESLTRGLADANRPGLSTLRTREGGDFTLGLLDGWAAVTDGVTFYSERAAQEAYLGTATERESIRHHARLIGYEMSPAKAASVHLAFEADDKDAPPDVLEYTAGLQVRSVPRDGELPQTFETIEPLTARASWNAMRPRMRRPQVLEAATSQIRLAAEAPALAQGDAIVFLAGQVPQATGSTFLRRATTVVRDKAEQVASLAVDPVAPSLFTYIGGWVATTVAIPLTLTASVSATGWRASALMSSTALGVFDSVTIANVIMALPIALPSTIRPARFGVAAGCFGNNAISGPSDPAGPADVIAFERAVNRNPSHIGATRGDVVDAAPTSSSRAYIYLERAFPDIVPGQPVLIRDTDTEGWSPVHGVETMSVEAYGLSVKVTRLEINATLARPGGGSAHPLSAFSTRRTTVYAVPQDLPLAELPVLGDVGDPDLTPGADQIELDTVVIDLAPGKHVALTGARSDLPGAQGAEILEIAENTLANGRSLLTFTRPLTHRYFRDTVVINANVAQATHGETVVEILGDGDAVRPFASYTVKSNPLTHVSAPTDNGMAPALEVRVDGVKWDLVADFAGADPEDRIYILRIAEDGAPHIIFGDGVMGQRPQTGVDNITAVSRKGAGMEGLLEAGQLSLLSTKPAGLKGVTNPLPPAGAAPAETLEAARTNAPLKVLTLGRVVSLRDYEDFARGFAGIAKARADWTFDGFSKPIFLTVAGEGGAHLPESGVDMVNLARRLREASEVDQAFAIRNYARVLFRLSARLWSDPAFRPEDVELDALQTLTHAFDFDARMLGQGVSAAQVIAVLQSVPGVLGVDLDALHRAVSPVDLNPRLVAAVGRPDLEGALPIAAELLTIDSPNVFLEAIPYEP